eukprot:scaffold109699_cov27-Tisochrysis_lutea.AAC.1
MSSGYRPLMPVDYLMSSDSVSRSWIGPSMVLDSLLVRWSAIEGFCTASVMGASRRKERMKRGGGGSGSSPPSGAK